MTEGLLASTVWSKKQKEGMVSIKNIKYHRKLRVFNLANVNNDLLINSKSLKKNIILKVKGKTHNHRVSNLNLLQKPASEKASRDIFDGFLLISARVGLLLLIVMVAIVTKKTESSNYSYNTSRHRSRLFVYPASIHMY